MDIKMKVSYSKLWKLLIDKKMKKTQLKAAANIAPSTYSKLNNDGFISINVLVRICGILECDIGDIMEVFPEVTNIN